MVEGAHEGTSETSAAPYNPMVWTPIFSQPRRTRPNRRTCSRLHPLWGRIMRKIPLLLATQNRTDSIAHTFLRARKLDATTPDEAVALYDIVQESWGRASTLRGSVWSYGRRQWRSAREDGGVNSTIYSTRREATIAALHPHAASEWMVEAVEIDGMGRLAAATLSSAGEVQRLVYPEGEKRD